MRIYKLEILLKESKYLKTPWFKKSKVKCGCKIVKIKSLDFIWLGKNCYEFEIKD